MTKRVNVPKTIKRLYSKQVAPSRIAAIVIVLLVASVGTYILLGSHAATPTASTAEAEGGSKSGTTSVITDTSASAGSALKFGTVATGTSGGSGVNCTSNCQPYGTGIPNGPSGSWVPKLDDEFNGNFTGDSGWADPDFQPYRRGYASSGPSSPGGYTGGEAEAFDPKQTSQSGGNLVLTATYQSSLGKAWTSGTAESKTQNFTYGYFEARIKVPDLFSGWTAYWLTSAVGWPPEYDILENTINTPSSGAPSFTDQGVPGNRDATYFSKVFPTNYNGDNFTFDTTNYHTYGFYWEPGDIKVYYDGKFTGIEKTGSSISSTPMYLIFDYALGGGKTPPNPPNNSQMFVDYTRVWQ